MAYLPMTTRLIHPGSTCAAMREAVGRTVPGYQPAHARDNRGALKFDHPCIICSCFEALWYDPMSPKATVNFPQPGRCPSLFV